MNCLDGLKLLENNSVDSIVTDPPYELTSKHGSRSPQYGEGGKKHYGETTGGFMGMKWDATGIAHSIEMWKECLRVLKPGGYLLSFGGSRTYHRMACAIEDAGFEIRDQIMWVYGSGFPKSMDISKAIDKSAGAEREVIGKRVHPTLKNVPNVKSNAYHVESLDSDKNMESWDITTPTTDEAKKWDGWGTALKPAHEPIVVARKPLSEKTVVNNVLRWETGGINIDDCRVATEDIIKQSGELQDMSRDSIHAGYDRKNKTMFRTGKPKERSGPANPQGRFPANIIFDEEAGKLLDEQSGIKTNTRHMSYKRSGGEFIDGIPSQPEKDWFKQETGGASRFFYCAKASKKERGEGNTHPTVKPIALIKYLITLVTPPNGICLDPFEGSGTHALACEELGFKYIGFELENTYCEIAENRLKNT